ncbi:beta-1,4-glucuronyltransferase 1-like [Elysia marginata]|uniref:Beta-1,4-glucuronyltransferase 1 n=1 Tax=Elysia marginata TaxID=1093978 RepID=A0AAV4EZQ6_9GAST|nr:beta-1,4-glucuronyltransferase 1-like [Elysia marginata]
MLKRVTSSLPGLRAWSSPGQSPIQCKFWPCLTSLVLVIVLLQLLHLALLSRLEGRDKVDSADLDSSPSHLGRRGIGGIAPGVGRQLQGRSLDTVLAEMEERVRGAHRLDKSGTYHLLDNFLPSELAIRGRAPFDVSLVTQCSSSRLGDMWSLAARWGGPASVAVFTWDDDFAVTVSHLLHLHFCNDHVFRHVSFHLVYPIMRAPGQQHLASLAGIKLDCSAVTSHGNIDQIFTDIPAANYAGKEKELAYPNNLLRNFAINYAQTPYVFVIDVDMIPSEGLRTEFQKFMSSSAFSSATSRGNLSLLLTNSTRGEHGARLLDKLTHTKDNLIAFVVPAFELETSAKIPSGKSELLDLWTKGLVRPFYWDVCQKCQEPTNYDRWRALRFSGKDALNNRQVSIGFSVEYKDPWEPFYIARTSLPLYDERFKQYGFNRISQVSSTIQLFRLRISKIAHIIARPPPFMGLALENKKF